MHWIAPSEKDTDTAALERRLWDAAEQAVPAPITNLKSQEYSGARPEGLLGLIFLCLAALLIASAAQAADTLTHRQWTVDGIVREALVYVPPQARTNPTPVVFALHGHGGSMHNAARTFNYHTRWPEALVVYMQGLNTPGRLTDPEGRKPGWQHAAGEQDDRDLKFFDAVLASLHQD